MCHSTETGGHAINRLAQLGGLDNVTMGGVDFHQDPIIIGKLNPGSKTSHIDDLINGEIFTIEDYPFVVARQRIHNTAFFMVFLSLLFRK